MNIEDIKPLLTSYLYTGEDKYIKPVKIVSYKSLDVYPLLKKLVLDIKPKCCYANAYWVSTTLPDIEYVEGDAVGLIPVMHAWNCYKGQYFDMTWELHSTIKGPYFEVVKGTISDLIVQDYKFNTVTDLYTQWLNKLKPSNKSSIYNKLKSLDYDRTN